MSPYLNRWALTLTICCVGGASIAAAAAEIWKVFLLPSLSVAAEASYSKSPSSGQSEFEDSNSVAQCRWAFVSLAFVAGGLLLWATSPLWMKLADISHPKELTDTSQLKEFKDEVANNLFLNLLELEVSSSGDEDEKAEFVKLRAKLDELKETLFDTVAGILAHGGVTPEVREELGKCRQYLSEGIAKAQEKLMIPAGSDKARRKQVREAANALDSVRRKFDGNGNSQKS